MRHENNDTVLNDLTRYPPIDLLIRLEVYSAWSSTRYVALNSVRLATQFERPASMTHLQIIQSHHCCSL